VKTNKTFTKESRTKIRNQKNKNWSININNYEDNFEILNVEHNFSRGRERKDGKKSLIGNNSSRSHQEKDTTMISTTLWKSIFDN
jgi:uncharacterized membrane protein